MQLKSEMIIVFLEALFFGFVIMPVYYIAINKLNNLIDSEGQSHQTMLDFVKGGVGLVNLLIVFILPITLICRYINNSELAKDCITVHMITFAISSIISAIILFKTGRIEAIWKRPF